MSLLDGVAWEKENPPQVQTGRFYSKTPNVEEVERGTAATRGHLSGNGGLRGHSVGDVFPLIIVAVGHPDSLCYQVWYPDGRKGIMHGAWELAHREAVWHNECMELSPADAQVEYERRLAAVGI